MRVVPHGARPCARLVATCAWKGGVARLSPRKRAALKCTANFPPPPPPRAVVAWVAPRAVYAGTHAEKRSEYAAGWARGRRT